MPPAKWYLSLIHIFGQLSYNIMLSGRCQHLFAKFFHFLFQKQIQRVLKARCALDSFYSQTLGKLLVGVYNGGLIGFIDHHARLGSVRLLYIAHLGVIHRYLCRFRCLAMGRRQNARLLQGAVGHLPALGHHNNMGARSLLGVEPDVIAPALPQGQPVVLDIVASHQNGKAVIRLKPQRRQLLQMCIRDRPVIPRVAFIR